MKVLIAFSLKRRFLNSSTILLNILLCLILGGAFFADRLVTWINPGLFDDQIIYLQIDDTIAQTLQSMESEGLKFEVTEKPVETLLAEEPKALVLKYAEGYELISKYQLDPASIQVYENLMNNVHQTLALSQLAQNPELHIPENITLRNQALQKDVSLDPNKQNLIFMVITSIYFTMLSFSTSVANEVVYEKSTRQLELILTSVNAKTHFLSKMLIGWLNILIQFGCLLIYLLGWFLLRNQFDQGIGILAFLNRTQLVHLQAKTFYQLLSQLKFDSQLAIKCGFIFVFLMLGIIFIQMLLSIVASFVNSIEQAGSIQSPFYLILLAVYYFTLSINTPYQLSEGIGFYCSFLPVLNMLLIPARLLIQNVSLLELILSAGISCISMFYLFEHGSLIYQRGVLDYTGKGILSILGSMLQDKEEKK